MTQIRFLKSIGAARMFLVSSPPPSSALRYYLTGLYRYFIAWKPAGGYNTKQVSPPVTARANDYPIVFEKECRTVTIRWYFSNIDIRYSEPGRCSNSNSGISRVRFASLGLTRLDFASLRSACPVRIIPHEFSQQHRYLRIYKAATAINVKR